MRRILVGLVVLIGGAAVVGGLGSPPRSSGAVQHRPAPRPQTWVATNGASNSLPAQAGKNGYCYSKGECYNYVSALIYHTNEGAEDDLIQAAPKLSRNAWHSLEEIAVRSADGKQIVEIGWISAKPAGQSGGSVAPRLFVFHWINGIGTCYSAPHHWCGFVSTSKRVYPSMKLRAGRTGHYSISYGHGRWNLSYDHVTFGYFPGRDWHGTYTQAGYVQTFGEIAATAKRTCTEMGNGLAPTNPRASAITDFHLYGSTDTTAQMTITQPQTWNDLTIPTGFRLGGRGDCAT